MNAAEATGELRGRRVLVIEDNVDAAESLRDVLELDGHVVAMAFDGADGLAKAREFRPDLVLCDIGLPGIDGYDVARAFRSDVALAAVHLVALSGYAQPEDVKRARQAGFDAHLGKPPSMEALRSALFGDRAPVGIGGHCPVTDSTRSR
jgi:two-component system CheB/CheR fusion protein